MWSKLSSTTRESSYRMVSQQTIADSLGQLIGWLERWRDQEGAYNGFVVHRFETKRMGRVHDTAWTQAAMIRGYGNLYRKSRVSRWRGAMICAADCLASRYDSETARIHNTGHEDDRFHSLVSCALGVCALLAVMDLVDPVRQAEYKTLCINHVKRYWLDVLWVDDEGAFKFAETDWHSLGEDRFVINFNAMAAEALLAMHKATGEQIFRDYALRVGDWLLERWENSQAVNTRLLNRRITIADDPSSKWMAPGGFSYQFTPTQREPDNYVTIYTGLSLRGFRALFEATRDTRYADMIRAQTDYLLAMRDSDTHLFYHTAWGGKIEKNPQFIAGTGMTLLGLYEVRDVVGSKWFPKDTVRSILDRAYPNGSYPGFIGKNDTGRPERSGGGQVWEDVAASMNWNAQWFEFLTCIIEDPGEIKECCCEEAVKISTKRFIYRDSPKRVQIISWWPPRSWGIFAYLKKRPTACIAIYPKEVYGRLVHKHHKTS